MRAMPPKGQKVMSRTWIPKDWAARLCPSSCKKTTPKSIMTKKKAIRGDSALITKKARISGKR